MANTDTFYVVRGTILRHSKVAFRHGEIIRNKQRLLDNGWSSDDVDEELKRLIKTGHLAPATMETVQDVVNNQPMKAPQAIADMSTLNNQDIVDNIDDDAPYVNNPSTPLGYDPKFLAQKSERELRDIVKQAQPGVTQAQLDAMPRTQLEDILQSDRDKGRQAQATHELGGDVVPKT